MSSRKRPGFASGGGMSARITVFDWRRTSLGASESWPDALKTTTALILNSRFPQAIAWGPDLITIYNDAFARLLGNKHCALGAPFNEIFAEAWKTIGPICRAAFRGETTFLENFPLVGEPGAAPEQAYFTFCYGPIHDGNGDVVGMLDTIVETTETVRAVQHQRRLAFFDELSRAVQAVSDANSILAITTRMVGEHLQLSVAAMPTWITIRMDLPSGAAGLPRGSAASPATIGLLISDS